MSPHCYNYYWHAISWNDHGIECMKQQEYQQAISHFQTSLRCVKRLLTEEETHNATNQGDDKILLRHHSATSSNAENCCHNVNGEKQQQQRRVDVLSSDTMMMTTIPTKNDEVPMPPSASLDDEWHKFRPIRIAPPANIMEEDNIFDNMTFDRLTCVLLYNIGICNIHSIIWHSRQRPFIGNETEKSSSRASHMLCLSYQIVERMISSYDIVNERSIQAWYGWHQIEFRILSAMIFLMPPPSPPSSPFQDSNHSVTETNRTTMMMVSQRMVEVHHILMRHRDLVHMLATTFPTTAVAAPCA